MLSQAGCHSHRANETYRKMLSQNPSARVCAAPPLPLPASSGIQDCQVPTEAMVNGSGAEGVNIAVVHMLLGRTAGSFVCEPVESHQ